MSKLSIAVSSVAHSAAMKAAQPLESALKKMALSSGWPEEAVNYLSVNIRDGHLVPYYPDHAAKIINDLEYGTETEPPKMVLRKFKDMLPELMGPYMERELEARMSEIVSAL